MQNAFKHVLDLERRIQASVINFLNTPVGAQPPQVSTPSTVSQTFQETPVSLTPINISGFYSGTGPVDATFYATTDTPLVPVGPGWYSSTVTGIQGKIRVKSVSLNKGPGYNWSFVFQVYKNQNIEGTPQVINATLYPPNQMKIDGNQVPMYGYYTISIGVLTFFFTTPPPSGSLKGWIVTGLPGVPGALKVASYGFNNVTLVPADGSVLQSTSTIVNVNGFPATLQKASTAPFIPAKFTSYVSPESVLPDVQVAINSNVIVGNYPLQRDLNTDVSWCVSPPDGRIFPESPFIEIRMGLKNRPT